MATQRSAPAQVLVVGSSSTNPEPHIERGSMDSESFSVSTIREGREALDRLANRSVDCIVAEDQLADMEGLDFLRRVRETHGDVPVVMLVPADEETTAREFLAAGASDCLPRRWATEKVLEHRVKQAIATRTASDDVPRETTEETAAYRLLVNEIVDYAIFMLNPDGYVVSWNTGARRLKGYERDEILGQHFSVFYTHDAVDAGVPEENLEAALDQGHVEEEGWRVRKDGSQFWAQVTITALFDDDGDLRGFAKVTRDMTDRHEKQAALHREQELNEQFRLLVENVTDYAIFRLDTNGNVVSWNKGARQIKGYDPDEILGEHFSVFYPRDDTRRGIPSQNLETAKSEGRCEDEGWRIRQDGSQFWAHVTITALRDDDGELTGFAKVTKDMTERRQYEQAIERQRDELAALEQVNTVIREIDQLLLDASTQEAIERDVCERLTEEDAYRIAWIGGPDADEGRISPRSGSGIDGGTVDSFNIDISDSSDEVIGTALQTQSTQVIENVRHDPVCAPWRDTARQLGIQSGVVVPIVYEESIFGVLSVFADRPYAFEEREVDVLAELGETIGHAINAIKTKKMLLAESLVELEFRSTDRSSVLAAASSALDATVELEGVTPATGGEALYYASVEGASTEAVTMFAEETTAIDRFRPVEAEDDRTLVEFVLNGDSPTLVLTNQGGNVKSAAATDGELRLLVEVSPGTDVRSIVESVRDRFEEIDLIAQREVDRTIDSERAFQAALENDLTERQQTVLQAAYHAGFLEQPRESTGDELAGSLGITASTFHQHFRTAERKLIEGFLNGQ